jgi:Golgi apparatus protein 1
MKHTLRLLAKIVLLPLGISVSSIAHAQTDVMNVILERLTAGIKRLETACSDDIKKYCSTVTPGEGRMLYCMQAHEDKISATCGYEMNEVAVQVQTTADSLREAVAACRDDIGKFCGKTLPGQGRIAACLAANSASVSKSCMDAVHRFKNR